MKRPVCVFCFIGLLTQLAAACLPQAAFWPLAAFCVLGGAVAYFLRRRTVFLVLALAILSASALYGNTRLRLVAPARQYSGQTATVRAVVNDIGVSYIEGMVSATLSVQAVNGEAADLLISCACLPDCEMGDVVEAELELHQLPENSSSWGAFADGIFVEGEYLSDFQIVGEKQSLLFTMRRFGRQLSANVRRYLSREEGAILAAMTTGDRRFISTRQNRVYRQAGIPHILVISGLHVSALCGILTSHVSTRKFRVLGAWLSIFMAFFMMSIVGFTPSVTRAGLAALILNIGVLLLQPGDGLTALGIAVFAMSSFNTYAVCDLALQLSFAATFGVLFGAELTCGLPEKPWAESRLGEAAAIILQKFVPTVGASLCTFPVLVFWGMNVSAAALLANMIVLWMAKPILLFGFLTALCGLTPFLQPLQRGFGLCGGVLVRLLNGMAEWFAALPGSQLYFETSFAAVVVLILAIYAVLLWKLKLSGLQVAAAVTTAAVFALALGSVLQQRLIRVALVGNTWTPAVVVTQNQSAVVLYRGGYYNETEILEYLNQRGIEQADWVVDLRYSASSDCDLQTTYAILPLSEMDKYAVQKVYWQDVTFSLYSTGNGGAVWMDLGGVSAVVTSGALELYQPVTPDLLLAASSDPKLVQADTVLTLHQRYSWLDSSGAERVYYGQAGLHLLVSPYRSYRIGGVLDGG